MLLNFSPSKVFLVPHSHPEIKASEVKNPVQKLFWRTAAFGVNAGLGIPKKKPGSTSSMI